MSTPQSNSHPNTLHADAYTLPQVPTEWRRTWSRYPGPLSDEATFQSGTATSTLNYRGRTWITAGLPGWERYGYEGMVDKSIVVPPNSRVEFGSGLALRDMSRYTAITIHPPVKSND